MSAPIGPGDWVECIASGECGLGVVVVGRVYRVARLWPAYAHHGPCMFDGCADPGVELAGQPNGPGSDTWCINRFRPIYRPNQSIIEQLKQPAPEREPETV